jgi:hypothetical protein
MAGRQDIHVSRRLNKQCNQRAAAEVAWIEAEAAWLEADTLAKAGQMSEAEADAARFTADLFDDIADQHRNRRHAR